LYEQGWPDDTLLEFDFMDDDAPAAVRTSPAAGAQS